MPALGTHNTWCAVQRTGSLLCCRRAVSPFLPSLEGECRLVVHFLNFIYFSLDDFIFVFHPFGWKNLQKTWRCRSGARETLIVQRENARASAGVFSTAEPYVERGLRTHEFYSTSCPVWSFICPFHCVSRVHNIAFVSLRKLMVTLFFLYSKCIRCKQGETCRMLRRKSLTIEDTDTCIYFCMLKRSSNDKMANRTSLLSFRFHRHHCCCQSFHYSFNHLSIFEQQTYIYSNRC